MDLIVSKVIDFVRNSFFRLVNKEFLIFLVFLAMSTGFWFVMALNETYEKELPVPIVLVDVPQNIIITDGLPDTVRVTVRDKGIALLPYYYGNFIEPLRLSFASYMKSNGRGAITQTELQKLIYPMLYASTKITAVKAEKLEFYFNYGMSKRVPVSFDGEVGLYEQYYLAKTQIEPDSVVIYASEEVLDSIREVFTDTLKVENFRDTLMRTLTLKKIRGVKMVPNEVRVSLYADMLTETTVTVPVTTLNIPDGYVLRTFPSSVSVKVVVGRNKLKYVRPENFQVVVDYRELMKQPSEKCRPYLRVVPRGITNAMLETQLLDYLIETKE